MSRPKIVAFAGSLHRPSRTRTLLEAIGAELGRHLAADLRVFDLVDAGPGLGSSLARTSLTLPARRIVDAIETADALIVGSPVYKGSYTGLFKHVFDLVEPEQLAGKPVVLAASGGGPRHALVVEHALRPLFGFFTALTVPTAVYAADGEIVPALGGEGYVIVDAGLSKRIADAARQLALLLPPQPEASASGARFNVSALRSPDR